jgi:antitoxin component HigA of HigAB toxin-antitoxin module
VIETDEQYREVGSRFAELIGKGKARTGSKTRLMRLLALLVEDYDRRRALPPDDATPAERLRFLLEHSGRTSADLIAVFRRRSHVHEALTGKRRIGPQHARRLGKIFGVDARLFL